MKPVFPQRLNFPGLRPQDPTLATRQSGRKAAPLGLLWLFLLACGACSRSATPSNIVERPASQEASQSVAAGGSVPEAALPSKLNSPRAFVVELIERNEDSFAGLLFESDDSHGDEIPALEITDEKLVCREFVLRQSEEQVIETQPSGTPLDKCNLFVIHTIHFAGQGRVEAGELYFAAAGDSASIPIPDSPQSDTFTHDPNLVEIPFETALLGFRFFPQDAQAIGLHLRGNQLEVTLGKITKTLQRDERMELFQVERELTLSELPLLGSAVTDSNDLFDENPEPITEASSELTPRRDHGKRKFSTKVTVICHGEMAVERISKSPENTQ